MYSYFLYEIIRAIFFGVGAKLVQIVKISYFLSYIVVASNFQDVFIFAIHEIICVIILVVGPIRVLQGLQNLRGRGVGAGANQICRLAKGGSEEF